MSLRFENVGIALGAKPLIRPFMLSIKAGEVVTLMGPSGCGKSSLLAYVAGDLEAPLTGAGRVVLNGVDLADLRPEQRQVGRLFQDDLLFPHMTVGENLMFGVKRGQPRLEMMQTALARAGLEGFEDRSPQTLSGGQRVRVSLMRALLAKPDAMLLDEPFNKLDKDLRATMRAYVFDHLLTRNIPCLMVTHDQDDVPNSGRVFRVATDGEVRHV